MKIFISHSSRDIDLVNKLKADLHTLGQEVIVAADDIIPGQDWTSEIKILLEQADILIPVITEEASNSNWVMFEIGVFSEYVRNSRNSKLIIPIVFDNARVPTPLHNFMYITANQSNVKEAAQKIQSSIAVFEGKRLAKEEEAKEVEISAADYIKETITTLEKREKTFNRTAIFWQISGFLALVVGVSIMGYLAIKGFGHNGNLLDIILLALKLTTIIILLLSISKFSFNLSKTYMHESLKNSDRIHAISFGSFYLRVFKNNVTKEEMKEIFTDWNFDKGSKFSELNANDYDPKLGELLTKALEVLKEKK